LKTNKISDAAFIEKFNDGLSHRELAAHFCVSLTTIQVYVKRLKLPKRETVDKIDEERLTKLWQKGYSCSMIGREFHVCGTTISRIARKMGLKERKLKKSAKKVSDTVVCSKPASVVPIPTEKKDIVNRFIIPPTLKQLEKQKQQAEIAKAEREYKIYKRDCGFTALKEEIDKFGN